MNLDGKIDILIPTTRPKLLKRCLKAIEENAGIPEDQYDIYTKTDFKKIGCPSMLCDMTNETSHQYVCFVGDDSIPEKDFLKNALDAMKELPDKWGLVGFCNTFNGVATNNTAGHFLADRRILPLLDNEFFHHGYRHGHCDTEMTERAMEHGKYCWAAKAVIENPHPICNLITGGERDPMDETYNMIDDRKIQMLDQNLFYERKAERLQRIAIAIPLAGRKADNQFWLSFIGMKKPNFILLTPSLEIYDFPQNIADVRNDLVFQAQAEGAKKLIMLDTDQVYQDDTIEKLLSHDATMVAAPVHRRYPPFDIIMYRGELGKYAHVADEEIYSGDLIEVDAIGTGCVCFDMSIFRELEFPWFELSTDKDQPIGEDIYFCSKMRDAGHEICVDTSIEIDHLGTMVVNKSTYQIYKKLMGFEWRTDKEVEPTEKTGD